ncbi:MAG: NAD-dependent epimerase/dehydratase [Actinomycetia bacterium]|nr:NAD-dependent epimerase/dehydratase [Actinomycetes bacterium]
MDLSTEAPVVVTGGAGFIGSVLIASLRADGVPVVSLDLVPHPDPEVVSVVGDVADPVAVGEALAFRPRAILHLAARTSVLRSIEDPVGVYRTNVEGTQHLLEAARTAGTGAFVLVSTNAVVGQVQGGTIDEGSPLRPLTPYGATKAAAEMLCSAYAASYGLRAATVRLTNVYGPGMGAKDTFVIRLLRAAARGTPVQIYGDGLQSRDYIYVDDVIAGIRLALDGGLIGPLVLGTGTSTSVIDLCRLAADAIGVPIATTHVPGPEGEMRAVRVDISRARAAGFEPEVALPEGLVRTWEALRKDLAGP